MAPDSHHQTADWCRVQSIVSPPPHDSNPLDWCARHHTKVPLPRSSRHRDLDQTYQNSLVIIRNPNYSACFPGIWFRYSPECYRFKHRALFSALVMHFSNRVTRKTNNQEYPSHKTHKRVAFGPYYYRNTPCLIAFVSMWKAT